ncbi:MAG: class I SAM-dependent methyltransferase [Polyangiaceae bacterium]
MSRERVRTMAHEAIARGEPTAWFERLYQEAAGDPTKVPWADLRPNHRLIEWCMHNQVKGEGRSACVVGVGLGDDAEALCAVGFNVTAFDVSETAIAWAKKRHPSSVVRYEVLDLFDAPRHYAQGFDFVFEAYTIQSMPLSLRVRALEALAAIVGPKGSLLLVARGRNDDAPPEGPPWPLSQKDLAVLEQTTLKRTYHEPYREPGDEGVERFAAEYRRDSV